MLPNDIVLMSIGHLDHVLIVYSSMEHMTWKSPGPMCGWVGRIPIHARRCLPDPKCLFYPSGLSLCLSVDHFCLVPVDDMVLFHDIVCDGLHCTALPCPGGSGLCTSCEKVHFFLVFLDPQTELPACLSNIRAGAVLAKDTTSWFPGHVLHRAVNKTWSRYPTDIETLSLGKTFSVV